MSSESVQRPQLSVVIASCSGLPYLAACLESLTRQIESITAEVIVVDCIGPTVAEFVAAHYPAVCLISSDDDKSLPELRALGIRAARGDLIAITEDHCRVAENWYQTIVTTHAAFAAPAIGGAVDNGATERLVDWAAYFCEYGSFASPAPRGIVHSLPAPNVSYKRITLESLNQPFVKGYRETYLHQQLEASGHPLWSDPALVVYHCKQFSLRSFLFERFHYSRWYAGVRGESSSWLRRLFYLILSPLLPPLILYRQNQQASRRKQLYGVFLKCLPLLSIFSLAWTAGEFVGYLLGPGQSVLELS